MKARNKRQNPHPLQQWLDYWNISCKLLSEATKRVEPPGISASFIRHYYGKTGMCSKKSAEKLSKTTGIPASILMFPYEHQGFKPEDYKPDNIHKSVKC